MGLLNLVGVLSRPLLLFLVAVIAILAFWFFSGIYSFFTANEGEVLVALVAAAVMALVGYWLTMRRGSLSAAGQYEKLGVWAALGLSIASSVTTTTGLRILLSANENDLGFVPSSLALLVGLSVQLIMLATALRIGQSMQQMSRRDIAREPDDMLSNDMSWNFEADVQTHKKANAKAFWFVVSIVTLTFGFLFLFDITLPEMWALIKRVATINSEDRWLNPIGIVLVVVSLFVLARLGAGKAVASVMGLSGAMLSYIALLFFSSGFGYLFYFTAVQTDQTMANDRDAVLRDRPPALVSQIRETTLRDVAQARAMAAGGPAFQEFESELNNLALIFRDANAQILAARDEIQRRRALEEQRLVEASQRVATAEAALTTAQEVLRQANRDVALVTTRVETSVARLQPQLDEAIENRDAELTGTEGGTGIAGRGPEYRRFDALAGDIQDQIDELLAEEALARLAIGEAEVDVQTAETRLAAIRSNTGANPDTGDLTENLLPPIVDASSFSDPMEAYAREPSATTLTAAGAACQGGRRVLVQAGIAPDSLPNCDTSAVLADLQAFERARAAIPSMEEACGRSEDERTADREAFLARGPADLNAIPPFLQERVYWVIRCLDAANTGTPGLTGLTDDVQRLESEYLQPGEDPRRILTSLLSLNRFALFSVALALVIDTAILFAGISANAQRGETLRTDHREVTALQLNDRLLNALRLVNPQDPEHAALRVLMLSDPIPDSAGTLVFNREMRVDGMAPAQREQMKMIMTAAHQDYARYHQEGSKLIWRMHASLVAQLTEIAGGARTAGQQVFDGADSAQGVTSGLRPTGVPVAASTRSTPPDLRTGMILPIYEPADAEPPSEVEITTKRSASRRDDPMAE